MAVGAGFKTVDMMKLRRAGTAAAAWTLWAGSSCNSVLVCDQTAVRGRGIGSERLHSGLQDQSQLCACARIQKAGGGRRGEGQDAARVLCS